MSDCDEFFEGCPDCMSGRADAEVAAGIRCSRCRQPYNPPVRIPSPTPGFCLSCAPASTESPVRGSAAREWWGRAS